MVRKDFENVPIRKELLKRIDAFGATQTGQKLGMVGRPEFLSKLAIAFLMKYDKEYQRLAELYQITDKELADIKKESAK